MIAARSWLYTILFVIWGFVGPLLLTPLLVTRHGALTGARIWVHGVMFLARTLVGVTFRAEGKENIPQGPCIIAAQHQSSFETYRLFIEIENPVFVFKRELLWVPVIGWFLMRAGLIAVNRGSGVSAMRSMMRAADKAMARGAQIVIFPEGTRIAPGAQGPYKPGVVALYNYCRLPVVPMALNSGYFWGKTRVRKDPGEIVFKYLPAVEPGLGKAELLATLRQRIESAAKTLPVLNP